MSSSGEEFLREHNLVSRSTPQQQKVLGCLACQWYKHVVSGDKPVVYGQQITNCSGLKPGTVAPILNRFEGTGVVSSELEDADPRELNRPLRRLYRPATSDLGTAFTTSLEVPPVCNLSEAQTVTPDDEKQANETDAITVILNESSPEQLEWIIAEASLRLEQRGDQSRA
jgi:hypothetical protein